MSSNEEDFGLQGDIIQSIEEHELLENDSIGEISKKLRETELTIPQAITLLNDCRTKYKSIDSFKVLQYTNVMFGDDYGKILDLLGLVCKVLKLPIIKSTYYILDRIISVLNSKEDEIENLKKERDNLKFINSKQFDDMLSMRMTLESRNAESKKKDNITENISKKLSEMELSIAQKDETIHSLKRTLESKDSEMKIKEDTIKKLNTEKSSLENFSKTSPTKSVGSPIGTRESDEEFAKIYALLEKSTKENNKEIIRFFCDNGYLNLKNHYGDNMILHAAWNNDFPLVKCLIEFGADPNSQGDNNHTVLALFCGLGNLEAVKYLCSIKSVNINAKNKEGDTPLHYATFHNEFPVIQYLCSLPNIQINIKDNFGKTPFAWAKTDEIKKFLRTKGGVA